MDHTILQKKRGITSGPPSSMSVMSKSQRAENWLGKGNLLFDRLQEKFSI